MSKIITWVIIIIVLLGVALLIVNLRPDQEVVEDVVTEITFVNHLQANLPEQDVFVESLEDAESVIRISPETIATAELLASSIFAATEAIEHDPFRFGENPLGPFAKGVDLGVTLGDWLAASGNGTYTVSNGEAVISFTATGLVPNGVYTVWCSRLTLPPVPSVVDAPCGAADGSENTATADALGALTYTVTQDPLEESSPETATVIALAYHSDGKTYGKVPGDFGFTSHVHIFSILPVPVVDEVVSEENIEETEDEAKVEEDSAGEDMEGSAAGESEDKETEE